jgi:trimethylamine--corrinoid protein Co-methyltransferase
MSGGHYQPLAEKDFAEIHEAVLSILENTGVSGGSPSIVETITQAGGRLTEDGRLTFPRSLVERALSGFQRGFTLHGQSPGHEMRLCGRNVHMGSGGASPSIVDLDSGRYRDSTLQDLYDAARLVDTLDNVHFFSRSLVARDMPDLRTLDINTAYACLKGTSKHVCAAASCADHVREIAEMCFLIAGSAEQFREQPFLSLNVNHVTPPLRIAEEAFGVLGEAAKLGIPAHANVFSQVGASSPVSLAGAVAQSLAEALAGGIYAWIINPEARIIFGPKPMIVDLRTGGMSGGGGEQALVMAAATQMAQYYDLPNVSIAGATDSKVSDAQSGYEKCLSVALAAHAGSNLITQACGMQASLLGCALESYVIDNDMLGGIMSSLRSLEINAETLSAEAIDHVARGEGHFLGEPETYARMKTDFLYPEIADRRTPEEWEQDGSRDIREVARDRTRDILARHYPGHIDTSMDEKIRSVFDIRLPPEHMG